MLHCYLASCQDHVFVHQVCAHTCWSGSGEDQIADTHVMQLQLHVIAHCLLLPAQCAQKQHGV